MRFPHGDNLDLLEQRRAVKVGTGELSSHVQCRKPRPERRRAQVRRARDLIVDNLASPDGGGSATATTVNNVGGAPQLSASPGRVDPTNSALNSSRKPLAGEITYDGRTLF